MLTADAPARVVPPRRALRAVYAHAPVPPRAPDAEPLLQHLEIVLDRLSEGTIVIDAAGRLLHANRRARELLLVVRDVRAPSGRLSFADARSQRAFEQALCRSEPADDDAPRSRGFLVRDGGGNTVARAWIEPLQRRSGDEPPGPPRFLVSLHQLPQHARISADTLQSLYGLTPSEARVAAHVVSAGSVQELSARLDLSRNTVKTHLRRTFRKCEVNSLAQLTALIATGPRVR